MTVDVITFFTAYSKKMKNTFCVHPKECWSLQKAIYCYQPAQNNVQKRITINVFPDVFGTARWKIVRRSCDTSPLAIPRGSKFQSPQIPEQIVPEEPFWQCDNWKFFFWLKRVKNLFLDKPFFIHKIVCPVNIILNSMSTSSTEFSGFQLAYGCFCF